MYLQFILTMPGVASWNGKWSGEGDLHAKTRFIGSTTKAGKEQAAKVLAGSPYQYRWPDGWEAQVEVTKIRSAEATRVQRKSKGFCGYDWMVDTIMEHQEIMNSREREARGKNEGD